jgi:hypothetical protein
MNTCRTIAIRLGIAFLFLLFSAPLWAGDCSGPDDCGAIPDNTTGAAGIAGAGAGIAIATGMKKKEEDEATLGEGDASDLDTLFGSGDPSGGADSGGAGASQPTKPRPDPGELGVEGPPSKPHSGPPDGPLGE